ncbi:MAG: hypothetical protein DRP29_01430 [Thermodesulfobacteriota bacterium]|nr:MAG: hypothetical protein DRP29_01430 [Thermodesulfobacteriota bacterium]
MKKFFQIFLIILFNLFLISSSYTLISLEEEEKIGSQVLKEISSQKEFIRDVEIISYLNAVGEKLVKYGVKFSPFKFKFFLIKDNTFNAFSVPGGYIFVNSGIFEDLDSEDELAGILSHEIAHNLCRHVAKKFEKLKKMQITTTIATLTAMLLGGEKIGEAVGITSTALAQTKLLAYSRSEEEEADRVGLEILVHAGYNPWGIVKIMEKLNKKSPFAIELSYKYLLTHPLPVERLNYLINLANKYSTKNIIYSQIASDKIYFKRIRIKTEILSNDPSELILRYQKQLKEKNDPWIRYALALILSRLGFYRDAICEMKKAITQLPNKNYFKLDLAEIYLNAGKYSKVIEILNKLKPNDNMYPTLSNIFILKKNYLLGYSLFQMGFPQKAYRFFKQIEEKNNKILFNNTEFYYYFGRICSELDKFGESHFYFGKYYELKGEHKIAMFHYRKALSFLNKDSKIYIRVKNHIKNLKN